MRLREVAEANRKKLVAAARFLRSIPGECWYGFRPKTNPSPSLDKALAQWQRGDDTEAKGVKAWVREVSTWARDPACPFSFDTVDQAVDILDRWP